MVLWLQGGPGSTSMFGLMELNGPFTVKYDGNNSTNAVVNPYAWTKKANMLYIDNPVGAGGFQRHIYATIMYKVDKQHY